MHHASCLPLLEPCNITSTHTAHWRKEKKERKKKGRLLSLYILRPNELYACMCSAQWWMNIFFLSLLPLTQGSKRAYERTRRREKKRSTLVGRLEARIEKNVI